MLFEKRKSKAKADPTEGNGTDGPTKLVEGTEEKANGLTVKVGTNDMTDPAEVDVFKNLGRLRRELKEFKKIRGGIRTTIESIENLVPKLKVRKERLVQELEEKRAEVEQLTQRIPQLNEKKSSLLRSIEQKKEQKIKLENEIEANQMEVERVTTEVPKLDAQKKELFQQIQQIQQDLNRITNQINEVVSIQEYGIDFVSGALVYASQKSQR